MLGMVYSPGKALGGLILLAGLALFLVLGNRLTAAPRSLLAEVGRYAIEQETLLKTSGYKTLSTPHFLIRYEGNPATAQMVTATAEDAKARVDQFFGNQIEGQIPVVIYPDTASMAKSMGWDRSQQAMGLYWAGTISVLNPDVWLDKSNDQAAEFARNGPMVHEYTHMQVDYLTGGNYTRWFTEGMAQYVEKKLNGFQFAVPQGAHDHPYTLNELAANFDNLNEAQAYWQSLTAVEYIIDKYGTDAPDKIMALLKQGYTMPEALERVSGNYDQLASNLYQMWQQ